MLSMNDVKLRYKRSIIGPFWSTINLIIFISFLSLIFSTLLGKNFTDFVPFLAFGFLFWNFISGCIVESTDVMIQHKDIIHNIKLPYLVHPAIIVFRNLIILLHNSLIIPFLFFLFNIDLTINLFYSLAGLILLVLNMFWISALVSVICLRYLDLKQIVMNMLNISFYLTPIIWDLDTIQGRFNINFLYFNPFFSLIESIRDPILNKDFNNLNYILFSFFFIIFGIVVLIILEKFKSKISLWV